MRLSELHYDLPDELVAKYPSPEREAARLLLVGPPLEHRSIADLEHLLPSGALLIGNDTRVLPARLFGRKATGGKVELLLVRRMASIAGGERWIALAKANRPLRVDSEIFFDQAMARVVEQRSGHLVLDVMAEGDVDAFLERCGQVPLPPYLQRAAEPSDRLRYQTEFAQHPGAVAAPTAGLHFTQGLLERLRARDIRFATITLHVGPGTFQPVTCDNLDEHDMHSEWFSISESTARAIDDARKRSAPVIAIGTTVVRALESAALDPPGTSGGVAATSGRDTSLLIQPGFPFRVVDALVTNFHLPSSTLLALVYAFGGRERVRNAYDEAIRERYGFYSYGDAMYLVRT